MLTERLLTIRDVSMMGHVLYELELPFARRHVQLADLVAERVRHEVEAYASAGPGDGHVLFEIDEVERVLNAQSVRTRAKLDVERQVEIALKGFTDNRFLVIIDDVQAESLEQWLDIGDSPEVHFLRLVPLEGG